MNERAMGKLVESQQNITSHDGRREPGGTRCSDYRRLGTQNTDVLFPGTNSQDTWRCVGTEPDPLPVSLIRTERTFIMFLGFRIDEIYLNNTENYLAFPTNNCSLCQLITLTTETEKNVLYSV
uniref:Uncharacterized protein n=1 Tax=Molossus molossus TaxID=27622 RepID=A0A7J8GR33_MOLMO|nr:hypothetical protein HJG59_011391 [Molossus molossus]